jgi:hypothetical protein
MCLIIDNNVVQRILLQTNDLAFKDVRQALFSSGGFVVRMVYGGKLSQEYQSNHEVMKIVNALDQAGRARKIDDTALDNETQIVETLGLCKSDDPHVIALARVARVGLLCSEDAKLMQDFKNKSLIVQPRGKVYSKASHKPLLRKYCKD